MKQYSCPDCGKTWSQTAPDSCPECGCPSGNFIVNEIIDKSDYLNASSVNNNEGNGRAKIYYADSICIIGDKIWEFKGEGGKGSLIFPVRNIAQVGIKQKYPQWQNWLLLGILLIPAFGVGIILIIIALVLKEKRLLMVCPNNDNTGFVFDNVSTNAEAERYLSPMRQCLLEN